MRIDRADLADGPGDAHIARYAQSAPDDPDAADKDKGKEVRGGGFPDSSPARPDSTLRTEQSVAYRANAYAVYRQYGIDHADARAARLECEPGTPAMRRIEGEGPERHLTRPDDGLKSKGPLAETAGLEKGKTSQSQDDTTADARGGAAAGSHNGCMWDLAIPQDRSGGHDVMSRMPTFLYKGALPEGYTSSPALKGDPYHPDLVKSRSTASRELYATTSGDRAEYLGYTKRIPAQKAPFDSHGQEVFTNGKNYITPDVDNHNVTSGWKMFSRRGARIGTYDSELNYVKE